MLGLNERSWPKRFVSLAIRLPITLWGQVMTTGLAAKAELFY